jgi:hypothetical protein
VPFTPLARIKASHTQQLGVGELVHSLLFIPRETCHKDRSPAIRHLPTCPVVTQALGVVKLHVVNYVFWEVCVVVDITVRNGMRHTEVV